MRICMSRDVVMSLIRVRYVSELKRNLISLSVLDHKSFYFEGKTSNEDREEIINVGDERRETGWGIQSDREHADMDC